MPFMPRSLTPPLRLSRRQSEVQVECCQSVCGHRPNHLPPGPEQLLQRRHKARWDPMVCSRPLRLQCTPLRRLGRRLPSSRALCLSRQCLALRGTASGLSRPARWI